MLNRFVREVVVPKGKLRLSVAVQRYMNVRIMLPNTPELFFPLHTGLLYGHGIASRSIWMPFVDVSSDADQTLSMQIIPIKKSRELIRQAIDQKLGMEEMTTLFDKHSHQIKAKPGSFCAFTQENIHGSGHPNVTDKTRVSMDFRGGPVRQALIEMANSYLILTSAGPGAHLVVLTGPGADVGVVAYQMNMLVKKIGEHLSAAPRAGVGPAAGSGE